MEYLILAILKILDSLLATSKSILVHKNKAFAASLMVFLSQLSYMIIMVQVIQSKDNTISILVVALSASVGTFLAFGINSKLSHDTLYINFITCDNKENMESLVEYLREHKIKNIVTKCLTKENDESLVVQAFCTTRGTSKLVDSFIGNSDVKYMRQIVD